MSLLDTLRHRVVALPLLAAFLTFAQAPSAGAVIIYNWSGACSSGCVGTASAVLTLADTYTPGTEVMNGDFLSFVYNSSSVANFTVPGDGTFALFLVAPGIFDNLLPAPPGGVAALGLDLAGSTTGFGTQASGMWSFNYLPLAISDSGDQHNWTLVPEPSTALLFLAGLLGLLGLRRRASTASV